MNRRKRIGAILGVGKGTRFTLRDDFTDTVIAGAVNGTVATPIGGTRTVVDTNSKISIGNGLLSFASGEAGNDALRYASLSRIPGRTLIGKISPGADPARCAFGWDANTSGAINYGFNFAAAGSLNSIESPGPALAVYTVPNTYLLADILRSTGHFLFIKGGTFINWTLLYAHKTGTDASLYPTLGATTSAGVFSSDSIRSPQSLIVISPIVSDAFTRSNGDLGNTDGGGSEEVGGAGFVWQSNVGTWGVSSNKAACSSLSGGIGIASVSCGMVNVLVEAAITRSSGNAGIVARYVDTNNYLYAYHDGTNAVLVKVVNGSPTTLISAAVTYSAGARLILSLNGTGVRMYYNDAFIGTQQTVSDVSLQTGTSYGLYTSDTGNSFDNFVVWAKGNGGEYDLLLNRYTT